MAFADVLLGTGGSSREEVAEEVQKRRSKDDLRDCPMAYDCRARLAAR
jgi:hypothetical protein